MVETVLRRTAVACAVLTLVGAMSDPMTWLLLRWGALGMTDGTFSSLTASFVVIIALVVALKTRPRLVIPSLSLLVTIAAFGLATYAATFGHWATPQGKLWISASGTVPEDQGPQWAVYPALGPYVFPFVTLLGILSTVGLGTLWLRGAQPAGETTG